MTGHCLCGNVTYSASADPAMVATCHCTVCQRQSGSAFSINVVVPRDSFKVSGETLSSFETTGTDTKKAVERLFCSNCGSPIASLAEAWPDVAIIKGGTLDDTSLISPTMHTWTGSAQAWVDLTQDDLHQLERGIPA
jgi:hypothetical protein